MTIIEILRLELAHKPNCDLPYLKSVIARSEDNIQKGLTELVKSGEAEVKGRYNTRVWRLK